MVDAGLRIRPMAPDDYDAVVALWRDTPGIGLGVGDEREAVAASLERNPGLSLVAFRGEALVAAVLCGHDGRRGSINHLAVVPSERGHGLGSELVDRCLDGLRAAGIGKCSIVVYGGNAEGQAFWRATGWKARDDLLLMQRTIDPTGIGS
jgi:ribosomal protein S18 acetylase RimI-like enzyme